MSSGAVGAVGAGAVAAAAIWSNAPKTIRESTRAGLFQVAKEEIEINNQKQLHQSQGQSQQQQTKDFPKVIPAGQKCRHGKWQPEPAETELAKAWTCYYCTFECAICGLTSVGLCDSNECRNV